MSFLSSPSFPSCFRPSEITDDHHHRLPPPSPSPPPPPLPPPPKPPISTATTLTTYTYHTDAGTVTLTWSCSLLGRSLLLHHHSSTASSDMFHLRIMNPSIPFFNNKRGSKSLSPNTRIFWNLSKARFGSEPEPTANYFLALVVDNNISLLLGDLPFKDAYPTCKARDPKNRQILITKKEHVDVVGKRVNYSTRVKGLEVEIEFHCDGENSRLLFCCNGERVLEVKRLKWKFRGNKRVEIGDGSHVRITWDVHDWMFQKVDYYGDEDGGNYGGGNSSNFGSFVGGSIGGDDHAVFMFRFEEDEVSGMGKGNGGEDDNWNDMGCWELGKYGKSWSSSSISISSSVGSFGGSSSVLEWSCVEESELVVPVGFTLLVYACRS